MKISGSFEVQLNPLDTYAKGEEGVQLGRMSICKTYFGPLNATSQGEMLTALTTLKGSAGYVAIEQVKGTLDGKTGCFVLQHYGCMNQGKDTLILEVVPNSGSGELTGLTGNMHITIDSGQHHYTFHYAFTNTPPESP